MNAAELSIEPIELVLNQAGHNCFRSGQALTIPCLGIDLLAHDVEFQPTPEGFGASVIFEARHTVLGPPSIEILAIGYGDTEADAANDAAGQWVIGVFPALLSYNSPDMHSCFVSRSEIIVDAPEPDQRYGWRVHVPPVLSRGYRSPDVKTHATNNDEVLGIFLEVISQCPPPDPVFWLECSALKHPDGSAEATCRYKNHDWAAGQQALTEWASGWPESKECMVTRRQFLFFERLLAGEFSADAGSKTIPSATRCKHS
jgi:hypothetical protein